ncbi:MAG TPA: hypothetical protein VFR31_03935 [Thermoanaerobaculia bacterium]|nr:hypothetical protein [Thermoanaerobaculia bacterium]
MKRSLVGAILLLSMVLGPLHAERVPGTNVNLQPPAGFAPADNFPGFQSAGQQASIMVNQLPAPVAEVMKGMNKESLAARGMTLISSSTEKVNGQDALLLHLAQAAGGVEYLKWMLLTGDPQTTYLIVGTFPKSAGEEVGAAIRAALLTTRVEIRGPDNPFEGLLFRITPTPALKISSRVSNMLVLTETGMAGTVAPGAPIYIVGSSIGPPGSTDLKAFSEARAGQTEQITDLKNVNGREITLGGLAAWELVADATGVKSGIPVRLYQVIAPDGDGYFIIQAFISIERADAMLPEFRRVTESFVKVGE